MDKKNTEEDAFWESDDILYIVNNMKYELTWKPKKPVGEMADAVYFSLRKHNLRILPQINDVKDKPILSKFKTLKI
jgi:hypothetical protein